MNWTSPLVYRLVSLVAISSFLASSIAEKAYANPVDIAETSARSFQVAAGEGQGSPPASPPFGSRGCENLQKPRFNVMVPVTEQANGSKLQRWGNTTQASTIETHPTFWFYIPYEASTIQSATLSLKQRQADDLVYQTSLQFAETPGIVGIAVPQQETPLTPGKWYEVKLSLEVFCSPEYPATLETVTAWIRYEDVDTTLKAQFAKGSPTQRAIQYAEKGFWYDALKLQAELQRQNPQDQGWANFLRQYGLQDYAGEPVVNCCTVAAQ